MIVTVKRNKNRGFIKVVLVLFLAALFGAYYYHMDQVYQEKLKQENLEKQAQKLKDEQKEKTKKDAEKAIVSEVEKAVELIGQSHIRHVKLVENKIVLICEPDTNLEALTVRYGAMAFVKKTLNEIVIAVDIDFILKNKMNEK